MRIPQLITMQSVDRSRGSVRILRFLMISVAPGNQLRSKGWVLIIQFQLFFEEYVRESHVPAVVKRDLERNGALIWSQINELQLNSAFATAIKLQRGRMHMSPP